jgi:predicted methyltransferase
VVLSITINLSSGDNFEILKSMDMESVDLIYLDPPFFSSRNYGGLWGNWRGCNVVEIMPE